QKGETRSYLGDEWNDKVSSVKVDAGTLTVYHDADFVGEMKDFTENTSYIGDLWNDQISSVKCH
ncbi:Beta and gamma crystallin domain protein, partial [Candidatus Thiomargarita nelsonii]